MFKKLLSKLIVTFLAINLVTTSQATWNEEAYLKTSNMDSNDSLGNAVAIVGNWAVVASQAEDSNQTTITNGTGASSDNSVYNSGAVYVFKRGANGWNQNAYLKPANTDYNDYFGSSVAISSDPTSGLVIVVGALQEDSNQTTITNGSTASSDNSMLNAGAAYVYRRNSSNNWVEEAYLKAPNANASDFFGYSVAVDGDTIVVGARAEDSNQTTITNGATASSDNSATDAGAVYVFKGIFDTSTGAATWSQEAYIKAANAEAYDDFGNALAISDNTIVVGARYEDSNQTTITNGTTASSDNSAEGQGASYVYRRTYLNGTGQWAQEAYLKPAALYSNSTGGDAYGTTVAVYGNRAVVGAPYDSSNQTIVTNGTGASNDNTEPAAGAAYVYKRNGTTWTQEAYLKAPNAESGDLFGNSVSILGDTIAVGAYFEDSNQTTITNGNTASSDNSAVSSGAVYIFRRVNNLWDQEAYVKSANSEVGDDFGISVGISNDTVLAGAVCEDSNQTTITNGTTASSDNSASCAGAAYVFSRQ